MPVTNPRSRRLPKILLLFGSIILSLLVTELFLQRFLPFSVATIGHLDSENAALYGWGFHPGEVVRIGDPDTGRVYKSLTNSRGWRDREHSFDNESEAFRIVIIGDSNTFGVLVPADSIYTRLLENELERDGRNIEVITLAYGRWGTDQELEALRHEGVKYRPDLVIFQFSANDLYDNTFFYRPDEQALKPFYYDYSESQGLIRQVNPHWRPQGDDQKDRIRAIIRKSEILKRIHGVYIAARYSDAGLLGRLDPLREEMDGTLLETRYSIHSPKIEQMVAVLDSVPADFIQYLDEHLDEYVEKQTLIEAMHAWKLEDRRETILRIFEARWFKDWSASLYHPPPHNPESYAWRLYFELMEEAKSITDSIGADLAIFSNCEQGGYEWERYWYRIDETEESMRNFLAPTEIVRVFAERNDIGFVNHLHVHTRGRNDMHPNGEGNRAMMKNLYAYVIENFGQEPR